jgi:protein involved in plasmid replication-relaxation
MNAASMSDRSSDRVVSASTDHLARQGALRVSGNDLLRKSDVIHRVRPARAEAIIDGLTERERRIVDDIGRLRLANGGQLRRLWFDSSPSGMRHARRVLAALTQRRVLSRLGHSVGGVRAGSSGYVYCLDVVGQRLLHPDSDLRRPWLPSSGFIRHAVMVSECYVQLVERARQGSLDLLGFEAEPTCWRQYVNRKGSLTVLKPDAYVRVGMNEYEDRWYLEADRATEDIPRIRRKCLSYVSFWQATKEAVFPRVLWVASRPGRTKALQNVVSELPVDHQVLFSVCDMGGYIDVVSTGAGSDATNHPKGGEE